MEFGDNFTAKTEEVDPAAYFLAREQSVLGELESEIIPSSAAATTTTASVGAVAPTISDDLLVDGEHKELAPGISGGGLESSTGSFEIIGGENNDIVGITGPPPSRVEQEKIRLWREEQKKQLEKKDAEEEKKKEELRLQAKQELEDWLKQTDETITKTRTSARNAEKQTASLENGVAIEPGTEWERIAKLCDFNPKVNKSGKDISRMRSIYLHLKQNPIPVQKAV